MKVLLQSERLLFRNFIPEDCEDMFMLNADWDVLKYTGDIVFHTIKQSREMLEAYQIDPYEKYGFGRMTVILKETNEIIGWCGMKYLKEEDEVDLGFRFHKRFWNKGYGTEASIACIKYAHETLKLDYLKAYALEVNIGSCTVLERVGFEFKGMVEKYDHNWRSYYLKLPVDFDSFLHKK